MLLAGKAATALLDRHRQDQGDWLRRVVIDLWGSTSLRTGGEDLGLALLLMGVAPLWDDNSGRVSGIEIVPLAVLDRPRVDVTLRISGFFRDAFPGQIALFDQAVEAVASREEDAEWNPLAHAARGLDGPARAAATARIFGAAPGSYGTGIEDRLARGALDVAEELGRAYLDGGAFGYGGGRDGTADPDGFAARVAGAEALVHVQDHAETDLLDGLDTAAHEGGFAAAAALLGAAPVLYHADTSRPEAPRLRLVAEEVARVVRGARRQPRLDRRDDAARLPRRRRDRPHRGRAARFCRPGAGPVRPAVRAAVRGHARRSRHRALPARGQPRRPCGDEVPLRGGAASRAVAAAPQQRVGAVGGGRMSEAARPVPARQETRGWCPGLFEPMASGDGLLLRIKPRDARLDAASARLLADAARRHGNGAIELTNRGNLQFRGFTASSATAFAEAAVAAGLADADRSVERRRNVLVSPLAGVDPGCAPGTLAVARAVGAALAGDHSLDRLPGKFGFVVDGGGALGLHAVRGDVALRAAGAGWRMEAGGSAAACDVSQAPGLALRLAQAALAHDPPLRPARDPGHGARLFRAAGLDCEPVPPPSGTVPAAVGPLPGGAFGVGVPPGRLDASLLTMLAELSDQCGDGILRITPWRSILLGGLRPGNEAVLRGALQDALLDPGDPRLRVASCIGAPGCARAVRPAPADAARLGALLPRDRGNGTVLHVSGCVKGCGHPGPAPLTLVGRGDGYDLVRNGRAGDEPALRGFGLDALGLDALGPDALGLDTLIALLGRMPPTVDAGSAP